MSIRHQQHINVIKTSTTHPHQKHISDVLIPPLQCTPCRHDHGGQTAASVTQCWLRVFPISLPPTPHLSWGTLTAGISRDSRWRGTLLTVTGKSGDLLGDTHSLSPLTDGVIRMDMIDDSAEIIFRCFLQEAVVSRSGVGRDVHSLMLSFQHCLWSTVTGRSKNLCDICD